MNNPKPFCLTPKKFKVFVLGADPTNFSDHGQPKQLEYVFGILSDEPRYFSGILNNLNLIGLHLEDVYVQNLVQEYQNEETSRNKKWESIAEKWIDRLKAEFDRVNPSGNKPVLVTAERIMKFLVNDGVKVPRAKDIYSDTAETFIYVKPGENRLNRPLFAFYRHPAYALGKRVRYQKFLAEKLR